MNILNKAKSGFLLRFLTCIGLVGFSGYCCAAGDTIGSMASTIISSLTSVAELLSAGSYIAGVGFAITGIFKFKAHKDNAQQTPIGQPLGLMFVAIGLLFLPSLVPALGNTVFSSGGTTAGPSGLVITGS